MTCSKLSARKLFGPLVLCLGLGLGLNASADDHDPEAPETPEMPEVPEVETPAGGIATAQEQLDTLIQRIDAGEMPEEARFGLETARDAVAGEARGAPEGLPPQAQRPEGVGRPEGAGRPETAGRPDTVGRPAQAGRPDVPRPPQRPERAPVPR